MIANRLSGVATALFGIALYALVIPYGTETVDGGLMAPQTLPNIAALIIAASGAVQAVLPAGVIDLAPNRMARAALYAALAAAAVWALGYLDFRIVAPVYVLTQMLMVGERRPVPLALGAIALPLAIWAVIVLALDRPLP